MNPSFHVAVVAIMLVIMVGAPLALLGELSARDRRNKRDQR